MSELCLRNRQRACAVDLRLLRRVVRALLDALEVSDFELAIHLVGLEEIVHLNETYLHHAGPTDVISFDHRGWEACLAPPGGGAGHKLCRSAPEGLHGGPSKRKPSSEKIRVHGEVFVCVEFAFTQAHRYRATYQTELLRYIAHGLLHLLGYDDRQPADRRRMRRAEARLLRNIARDFPVSGLCHKLQRP